MQLVRYEEARRALAAAHRVDEVKSIRDKAEAMAAYARQAKDTQLVEYATEIKVRAEQRCGELLARTEKHRGGNPNRSNDTTGSPAKLADMGLTKDESSRYQKLAAMPKEHFETAIATAKAAAGEVTTAFMLREAKKLEPAPKLKKKRKLGPPCDGMQFARLAILQLEQIRSDDIERKMALNHVKEWITTHES